MSDGTDLHTRTIGIETRPLPAGRHFVHAELRDVRHVDLPTYMGFEHPRGVVHHMILDLEIDDGLVVREIDARMEAAPFEPSAKTRGEGCRHILPNYRRLVGLRLDPSWALRVLELVGGPQGCFHLLSLAQCLPPAVRAATNRLCAGALRHPPAARSDVVDSCSLWRAGGPLWAELRPPETTPPELRRVIRVEARVLDGNRLSMRGRLRDERAGDGPFEASLDLDLEPPRFTITRADARLDPPPFGGCGEAISGVGELQRLSINKGFTGAALEKIGGGAGCAHLFALVVAITPVTPQAAGALAGFLGRSPHERPRGGQKNPQVDSCHMWRADGPLVAG